MAPQLPSTWHPSIGSGPIWPVSAPKPNSAQESAFLVGLRVISFFTILFSKTTCVLKERWVKRLKFALKLISCSFNVDKTPGRVFLSLISKSVVHPPLKMYNSHIWSYASPLGDLPLSNTIPSDASRTNWVWVENPPAKNGLGWYRWWSAVFVVRSLSRRWFFLPKDGGVPQQVLKVSNCSAVHES